MADGIQKKATFGSAWIDHFSPRLPEGTPKAINVNISFEEALVTPTALHLTAQGQRRRRATLGQVCPLQALKLPTSYLWVVP